MPLSDHEQRILAELEESLVRQDPQFAERVRSETVYRHAGRYCKWSALGFFGGVAILVVFYAHSVALGFVGVALMFACAVVFERNLRRMGKAGWHDLTRSLQKDPADHQPKIPATPGRRVGRLVFIGVGLNRHGAPSQGRSPRHDRATTRGCAGCLPRGARPIDDPWRTATS